MNTLEAFQMRCLRHMLYVCWWVHVSNAEVLQRSSLSTTDDILRHRRLSLFGHVARLDPRVPAHDALRLMVNTYESRKASWRRPPTLYCSYLRCGDLRSPGVMDRRNGSLGLRDDDDDDEG